MVSTMDKQALRNKLAQDCENVLVQIVPERVTFRTSTPTVQGKPKKSRYHGFKSASVPQYRTNAHPKTIDPGYDPVDHWIKTFKI